MKDRVQRRRDGRLFATIVACAVTAVHQHCGSRDSIATALLSACPAVGDDARHERGSARPRRSRSMKTLVGDDAPA